jgi:hypothetical protein
MTLEQDCLLVITKQMGPAAKAFLDRQCKYHLNKDSAAIQKNDLEELAKWCAIGTQLALGEGVAEKIKQGLLALK